ncbi:polymer-forming cytoskeletal protein [Candidatus Methylomirabilis sp.]|uniref:bactofilin family protein n=1 Tax=Candidatus Methylomirabilis sp. TaxID=2032687 RepID=UPI002A68EB47|nr:polymer-forming cytoskeletal protein [Candidatus Methylomirabilis sp.]
MQEKRGMLDKIWGALEPTSPEPTTRPAPMMEMSTSTFVVGEKIQIRGDLTGEGDVQLMGGFHGTIDLVGTVVIGESAQVEADIAATNIRVGGHVKGNLIASGRVDLLPTGSVTGNVKTGSIAAAEGASLHGEIEINRRQVQGQMERDRTGSA